MAHKNTRTTGSAKNLSRRYLPSENLIYLRKHLYIAKITANTQCYDNYLPYFCQNNFVESSPVNNSES